VIGNIPIPPEPLDPRQWIALGESADSTYFAEQQVLTIGVGLDAQRVLVQDALRRRGTRPVIWICLNEAPISGFDSGPMPPLHYDLTGRCRADHRHVAWPAATPDFQLALRTATALTDDVGVIPLLTAALWVAGIEGRDASTAFEWLAGGHQQAIRDRAWAHAGEPAGKPSFFFSQLDKLLGASSDQLHKTTLTAMDDVRPVVQALQALSPSDNQSTLEPGSWLASSDVLLVTLPSDINPAHLRLPHALLRAGRTPEPGALIEPPVLDDALVIWQHAAIPDGLPVFGARLRTLGLGGPELLARLDSLTWPSWLIGQSILASTEIGAAITAPIDEFSPSSDPQLALHVLHAPYEWPDRPPDQVVPLIVQTAAAAKDRDNASMSRTHDVFLSHSKRDEPVVRDLARRLRGRGLRVWFDGWEISPGDSIPSRIEAGLEGSAVLVLCVSKHSLGSDWATLESQTFRFRDPLNRKRRFIPLRLDDAPLKGSLAQFLYIDWRNPDDYEFERLVRACRTIPAESDGHPGDPAPKRVSLRIGIRHARFDIPHGWVAQSAAKVSEIQATEGDQPTVHAALHHPGASPELIYALTIWSTATPASMLTPENIPQLVLSAEQHTGLRAVSDVTPVSLDGAAGWLWHLQGVVPGALFGRPQVATMDVHCSEVWASVDAFTAIKMLLTAPRASAHEAADGLSSVILSWQWGP
jgi:hypothetical protein